MARLFLWILQSFQRISAPTAARCGGSLGVLAWHLGVRRAVVNANISAALGITGRARALTARQAYASMGANFIDTWTAGGIDGLERHVEFVNPIWARRLVARHGGLIVITPHIGSWDAAIISGPSIIAPVLAYAKPQHSAVVDTWLNRCRSITGATILHPRTGDRINALTVLRMLRDRKGAVGLLADQRPRKEEAIAATFLGQPAWCHPGPAFFARKSGSAVVPIFALRGRQGQCRVYALRPIEIDGADDVEATKKIMEALSAIIASCPGQYFWHHRRFSDPPGTSVEDVVSSGWRTGASWLRSASSASGSSDH